MDFLKKSLSILFVCVLALAATSCEEVLNVELPYEERLVINHFVQTFNRSQVTDTNEVVNMFELTRTAKINSTDSSLAVSKAIVQFTSPRGVFTATELQPGVYSYKPFDVFGFGDSVSVTVTSGTFIATSKTFIPKPPEIDSAASSIKRPSNDYSYYYNYKIVVKPEPNTAYYVLSNNQYDTYRRLPGNVAISDRASQVASEGVITLEGEYFIYDNYQDTMAVEVVAVDKTYERFLDSRYGSNNDISFGFGGSNPYFNVQGAGIGAFYGLSTRIVKLKIPR